MDDEGAERLPTRSFHCFWVLLLAIGAHHFNELRFKSTSVTAEVVGSNPVVPAIF